MSKGTYDRFQRVADPRAERFADRFTSSGVETDAISDPSFSFAQLRSNEVLRWDYRGGSTIFLVWNQDRGTAAGRADWPLSRGMADVFSAEGTNRFLLKINYWLGL